MDLAKISSSWWGNRSYGYAHTPGRHHQFVRSGFDSYGEWLAYTMGDELAADLLANRKSVLVLQGFFSAERDNLRRYPVQLYQAMARQQRYPNSEIDHFIERSWGLLLTANRTRPYRGATSISRRQQQQRQQRAAAIIPPRPCTEEDVRRYRTTSNRYLLHDGR